MGTQEYIEIIAACLVAIAILLRGFNDLLKAGKDLCRTLGQRCPWWRAGRKGRR